jgi:hypothetical protein
MLKRPRKCPGVAAIAFVLSVFLLSISGFAQVGVMAEGSRNVRDFGAKGDGITDETQAFIQALQKGRGSATGLKKPVSIYVPPGRYLIHTTLIVWSRTQIFGDWNNRPTLVLADGSNGFQNERNPRPFIVTAGGYNVPEDTTDWRTRTDRFNGSTNNTFDIIIRDIKVEIGNHNSGAWAFFWWCAQQTSLRNVEVDAGTSLGCLSTTAWGGGSTIANCKFCAGRTGYWSDATSMEFFRDCIFCNQTRRAAYINGAYMFTFLGVIFVDTAPLELDSGFAGVINLVNCVFQHVSGGGLIDQYQRSSLHLENARFDDVSAAPSFLPANIEAGKVEQWTSGKVINRGEEVSGADKSLLQNVCRLSLDGRATPRPGSGCVNVKSLGAFGDGVHDDTPKVKSALRQYSELFFPPGIYRVKERLAIQPGQRLFGCGVYLSNIELDANSRDFRAGSDHAFVTVHGDRQKGISIYGLGFINKAPGGRCLDWEGDPSSTVMDSTFENAGQSPLSPMNIVGGGGFFEELWNPAGASHRSDGVLISSPGPVWLYSFQPEHYTEYAIKIEKAENVVMMNVELERSSHKSNAGGQLQISNSSRIYLYGITGGSWRPGEAQNVVQLTNSPRLSLWSLLGMNVPCLISDRSSPLVRSYGPTSSSNNIDRLIILAEFTK